jgi:expansin
LNSGSGHCSYGNLDGSTYFAAINKPQYGNADYCGQCARLCRSGEPNRCSEVRIVDECPECKFGDLDLSENAFTEVADLMEGRVPIDWEIVPCSN